MPAVTYHYIRKSNLTKLKVFDEQAFVTQIKRIKSNYGFINPWEIVNSKDRKELRNRVLLTFDDGYKEHALFVQKVLDEFDAKAIFGVSTVPIAKSQYLKINVIHLLLAKFDYDDSKIFPIVQRLERRLPKERSQELRVKYFHAGRYDSAPIQYLKTVLQSAVSEVVFDELVQEEELELPPVTDFYLSKIDIDYLGSNGHMIVNHTSTHPHLDKLTFEEVEEEIVSADEILREIPKGYCPDVFIYPHGKFNENVKKFLSQWGTKYAFTIKEGSLVSWSDFTLEIPRISCNQFD